MLTKYKSYSAEASSLEDGMQSTSQDCSAKFDMQHSIVVVENCEDSIQGSNNRDPFCRHDELLMGQCSPS